MKLFKSFEFKQFNYMNSFNYMNFSQNGIYHFWLVGYYIALPENHLAMTLTPVHART